MAVVAVALLVVGVSGTIVRLLAAVTVLSLI